MNVAANASAVARKATCPHSSPSKRASLSALSLSALSFRPSLSPPLSAPPSLSLPLSPLLLTMAANLTSAGAGAAAVNGDANGHATARSFVIKAGLAQMLKYARARSSTR